jgi:murein DD-endopeptidase MepM/ murein hydrolase activator NlpD
LTGGSASLPAGSSGPPLTSAPRAQTQRAQPPAQSAPAAAASSALPLALQSPFSGVPGSFVESFRIPPSLLPFGASAGLSAARFPVHAPAHFSDGFQILAASGSGPPRTLTGTTIYSQAGAPAIAVQAGEIVQVGRSRSLGRFVKLHNTHGDTFVYAELGSVATLYPVLRPLQPAQGPQSPSPLLSLPSFPPSPPAPAVRAFREGPDEVYLYPLRAGVHVLPGTVLGHLGAIASGPAIPETGAAGPSRGAGSSAQAGPHMLFQIRRRGSEALIDPKPILDGWVALENGRQASGNR